jgi:hypothetical protein
MMRAQCPIHAAAKPLLLCAAHGPFATMPASTAHPSSSAPAPFPLPQVLRSDRDAAEEAAFHAAAAAAAGGKKGAGSSSKPKQPAAGAVYSPRSRFAYYVAAAWGRIGSSNPGRQLLEFRSAEEGASGRQTADKCNGGAVSGAGQAVARALNSPHWACLLRVVKPLL